MSRMRTRRLVRAASRRTARRCPPRRLRRGDLRQLLAAGDGHGHSDDSASPRLTSRLLGGDPLDLAESSAALLVVDNLPGFEADGEGPLEADPPAGERRPARLRDRGHVRGPVRLRADRGHPGDPGLPLRGRGQAALRREHRVVVPERGPGRGSSRRGRRPVRRVHRHRGHRETDRPSPSPSSTTTTRRRRMSTTSST